MRRPLFALLGVFVLVAAAVGPAVAASTQAGNDAETDAGNAPTESFGQQVSSFVHELQNSTNGTGIGPAVASFVTANNPGNAPPWAGSPGGPTANDTNATADENDTAGGPPAFVLAMFGNDNATAGNDTDRRGPPAHAGPGESGPPDHAGPNGPSDNETEASDATDTDGDDDDNQAGGAGNDGEPGPPDDAGPPGDRGP